MALINCGKAYNQEISGCTTEMVLDLGLTINTDYKIKYTFANSFAMTTIVTTGIDGKLTLTKDTQLSGFWNDATGVVLFEVQDTNGSTQELTICGETFTQINLHFKAIQTDDTTTNIPIGCA